MMMDSSIIAGSRLIVENAQVEKIDATSSFHRLYSNIRTHKTSFVQSKPDNTDSVDPEGFADFANAEENYGDARQFIAFFKSAMTC